jgi:hypothetical protein
MEECCLSNLTIDTYCVRVEVLTAVTVFWYVTPSGLVDNYQSFEETSFLYLQGPSLLLLLLLLSSSSGGGGGGNLHNHHRENVSLTQLLPVGRLITLLQSHIASFTI